MKGISLSVISNPSFCPSSHLAFLPSTVFFKAGNFLNKNRNYLEIRQNDPVAENLQNKSSFELVFELDFSSLGRESVYPLRASISVFLRKDKLCSGLKEEITVVVKKGSEALAGLPQKSFNKFKRITLGLL